MAQVQGSDGTPSQFQPNAPYGVWGDSGSAGPFGPGGNGVIGSSELSSGVAGFALANQPRAAGVYGQGPTVGVAGQVQGANTAPTGATGVYGTGSNGGNLGGVGVQGESDTDAALLGQSQSGWGILALTGTGTAVSAISSQGTALFGISNDTGLLAAGGSRAGVFLGDVDVTGSLSKGGGGFKIDHPLAPADKYLRHSFVESDEMKNVYDGMAVCGPDGTATIEMPPWFDALNAHPRYQLTPIGAAAPNLHVASPITANRFVIAGGKPALEVSWQVTAIRVDAWAKAHRIHPEEPKTSHERGRYLHPELYDRPAEERIGHERIAPQQHRAEMSRGGSKSGR